MLLYDKVYFIQAKKISFLETGKNADYSIWRARNIYLWLKKTHTAAYILGLNKIEIYILSLNKVDSIYFWPE